MWLERYQRTQKYKRKSREQDVISFRLELKTRNIWVLISGFISDKLNFNEIKFNLGINCKEEFWDPRKL